MAPVAGHVQGQKVLAFVLLTFTLLARASGEGFLGGSAASRRHARSLQLRSEDLQAALSGVLGCGAKLKPDKAALREAQEALLPLWQSLPKNQYGRVEWKSLRYMAHRHFMRRFAVLVRGLEPSRKVNASHAGEAQVLAQQVPALARQILDAPRAEQGFSLEDAAAVVAALERLVFDTDGELLEAVYRDRNLQTWQELSRADLQSLLKDYVVHWMMGDDVQGARQLLGDARLLEETVPHWQKIASMVEGSVRAEEFKKQKMPRPGDARAALGGRHSFEDALELVGGLGRGFSSFWETQCQDIKASLVELDTTKSGRVRLADFYGANKGGEWRFGESEAYLRELGALDESSARRGKQVIISNYLQAASNCIVSRPHFLVCCVNECEEILGEVEAAIGAPLAEPKAVLELVGNITSYDDDPAPLDEALRRQLKKVADAHGGKVPIHGRLFAQWLHYVFPRECAFPHKAGSASATPPSEFGDDFAASAEEVNKHVAAKVIQEDLNGVQNSPSTASDEAEASQWMTQWSEEEELPGDYSSQLRAPWERPGRFAALGGAAAAAASVVGLLWAGGAQAGAFAPPPGGPAEAAPAVKTHFV